MRHDQFNSIHIDKMCKYWEIRKKKGVTQCPTRNKFAIPVSAQDILRWSG